MADTNFYYGPSHRQLRTQKAKSVEVLAQGLRSSSTIHGLSLEPPSVYSVWPHERAKDYLADHANPRPLPFPVFARPAPTRPMHGFVDSRIVHDYEGLLSLAAQANLADPQAELIIMPPIDGDWSGIAVDGLITIGKGHDGATAGKQSVQIRTPVSATNGATPPRAWFDYMLDAAGNAQANYGYLEFVHNRDTDKMQLVQYRDGPPLSGERDFIPRDMTIGYVEANPQFTYELDGSWPRRVEELKANYTNPVVWLRNGSLASHHAVHAILAGIAVVTSDIPPTVGSQLVAGKNAIMPVTPGDAVQIGARLESVLASPAFKRSLKTKRARRDLAALAHGVVHSQHLWGGDEHHLLRAWGMAALLPLASMAIHGELRHFRKVDEDGENISFGTRTAAMAEHQHGDFARYRAELVEADGRFMADGAWAGGYGGEGWETFRFRAIEFADVLAAFRAGPTPQGWTALIETGNQLVHLSHNNGRVFDKFTNPEMIARVPVFGFINKLSAEVAWQEAYGEVPATMEMDLDDAMKQAQEPVKLAPFPFTTPWSAAQAKAAAWHVMTGQIIPGAVTGKWSSDHVLMEKPDANGLYPDVHAAQLYSKEPA